MVNKLVHITPGVGRNNGAPGLYIVECTTARFSFLWDMDAMTLVLNPTARSDLLYILYDKIWSALLELNDH